MKRSEMLEIMVKAVQNVPAKDFNIHTASAVLYAQEEAGMLPPSQYHIPHHDALYEWEPEEDE